VERHGRTEADMDLPRFAADLAKELGGTVVPGEHARDQQTIAIGDNQLNLYCHTYRKPVRVNVYINAPDVKHDDRNHYDKTHKAQDASVNPDARPIASIARDIKKRVIDASLEALQRQREYAALQAERRDGIKRQVAEITASCPELDVRLHEREQRATIYNRNGSHHVSGTLYADGTVSIERLGQVSRAKFEAILRLLNDTKGTKS
jgi:hypothetical protein